MVSQQCKAWSDCTDVLLCSRQDKNDFAKDLKGFPKIKLFFISFQMIKKSYLTLYNYLTLLLFFFKRKNLILFQWRRFLFHIIFLLFRLIYSVWSYIKEHTHPPFVFFILYQFQGFNFTEQICSMVWKLLTFVYVRPQRGNLSSFIINTK